MDFSQSQQQPARRSKHAASWCTDAFAALPQDMDGSWKRWKEWFDNEQPENEPLTLCPELRSNSQSARPGEMLP